MDIETKNSLGSLNRRLNEMEQELFRFRSLGDRVVALENLSNGDRVVAPKPKPLKGRREGWLNVYPDGGASFLHASEKEADRQARPARVACVKAEWEE